MEILTRKSLEKILGTGRAWDMYASDLLDQDLFEETDQFEVSSLRPMGDLDGYDGIDVLAWNVESRAFINFKFSNDNDCWMIMGKGGWIYYDPVKHAGVYTGFMPMPEYKQNGQK